MPKLMQVITAHHLTKGQVIFFVAQGHWSEQIAQASVFSDKESLDSALALARADEVSSPVVGSYEIDVAIENGSLIPVRLRERIRAEGPSVAYGMKMKLESFYAA